MTEETGTGTGPGPDGAATRRGLLAGAGVVAAAGLLAACGGSDDSGDAGGGDAGGDGGSGGGPSSDGGGGSATALGAVSAVPVGGGKVFKDRKIVVTQPAKGEFKAFSAVCTHRGCSVGSVAGGLIECPCHGSKFKIADGSVASGPAEEPLPARKVTVQNGQITLA
ncbi:Rieske (2Fe-2S) protein [Actinomadura sp. PM05-2]|uniref:Cytochrome bc1 complex Rieske iron-sulfur subunit n=2 Tax=Actinomadura parmotrematis TaxID=2864039 RepID=A0ABS7FS16_9ACTN|nr:Rieske (2Fe-2S) protein [Actinomadura parmotrematis]